MWNFHDACLAIAVILGEVLFIYIVEIIRRKMNLPTSFTRRMIHFFAGDAVLLIPFFTYQIYPLIVLFLMATLTTVGIMKKEGFFSTSMVEKGDVVLHAYGPVYYIISVLIMTALFWNELRYITMVATMVMAWGDGVASLIPKYLKKLHKYPWCDKSIEGSLSMLLFSLFGALLALSIANSFNSTPKVFLPMEILMISLLASIVGTVAEAISMGAIRHFDNFSVPFSVALVLYLLEKFF
ncbi:MAG: hypothetical protein B6U94_03635 [Thermofilum sp. ex4484_79]|nr:MAG: hypothetical protein B6U94_03635 [Thermofilum sp. ex4484_79]HDD63909.1 hypothetical protein [Thermoprotei archaeon]